MSEAASDVSRVLAFGREKLSRQMFLFAGICVAVGLLAVILDFGDGLLKVASWGLIVFGIGWAAWEFVKTTQPQKPLLVLSPEGLKMRIEGATEFLIPWTEVKGVNSITIRGPRGATWRNVTVVLVTEEFYDRVIHVDSLLLRGPGWDSSFIPYGSMMQVALHHQILPVTPQALRAAVEARWRAFG